MNTDHLGSVASPMQVMHFMDELTYPIFKSEIVAEAEQSGADENILATLEQLPDEHYTSSMEVHEALGVLDEDTYEL